MLIIINGTLGVGKTWIARWLLCELDNAAYIEGDILGFVSPSMFKGKTRQHFALEVAYDLIASYRRKGAKIIILDNLFTDPDLLKSFVAKVGNPVHTFYLSASPSVLASRIQKRGRPQVAKELIEAPEIEKAQRNSFATDELGVEIKTDGLSPEQVVDQIKKRLLG